MKTVEAQNIGNRRRIGIRRSDLLQLQVWQYSYIKMQKNQEKTDIFAREKGYSNP